MIWVLLPAFNEEAGLPDLLENIFHELENYTVVVVDDGSKDATPKIVKAFSKKMPVRLLQHPQNLGLGEAVKTGLKFILESAKDDDVIITMDADNTHPPVLIKTVLEAISYKSDIVIASRYAKGGKEVGLPLKRKILSKGANLICQLAFRLKGVKDYTCGYRAFKAEILKKTLERFGSQIIEAKGFVSTPELLVKASNYAKKISEVPLVLRYDLKAGASKMKILKTIASYLWLIFKVRRSLQKERS